MTPLHQELARAGFPAMAQMMSDLRDGQLDQQATMDEMRKRSEKQEVAIAELLTAFPANDVDGHRRYHASVIEWQETRNRLVREALTKMVGAGVLAATGWLLLAIWHALPTPGMK